MTAAEAAGGRYSPRAPSRTAPRPSPKPRAETPLRVVPPVADIAPEFEPAAETSPEAGARRIDWAAAGRRTATRGQVLYRDLVGAWVWHDVPPALRAIWASAGQPPIQHPLLAAGWRAWMYGIALPWTAIGYTAIWLHQHPARGIPTDLSIAAAAASIWIF
jgi:hypothetical protein